MLLKGVGRPIGKLEKQRCSSHRKILSLSSILRAISLRGPITDIHENFAEFDIRLKGLGLDVTTNFCF